MYDLRSDDSMHPLGFLQQPIQLLLSLVSGCPLTPDPALQILSLSNPNSYQTATVLKTLYLPRLQHPVCQTQWISLLQFPPNPDPDHCLKNRIRRK